MELWAMTEIPRILIVDDEPEIREELAEYLAGKGYRVIVAGDGPEALAKFQAEPCDLVITDMKMPGKSGADLIKEVRESVSPDMKFIVMTGHGGATVGMNGVDIKAYPFLRKPLDISELIESVKTVLGS